MSAIIDAAREAVGTPFRHQGRTVGKALDCAGLVIHAAHAAGFDPLDESGYPRRPNGGRLGAMLEAQPFLERVSEPQSNDVLLIHFEREAEPAHLAICAGQTIIHAWAVARKVCEHDFTDEWKRRVVCVYRFKGLT